MQARIWTAIAMASAALALPAAAQAKVTRAELRHDVRDVHQERHDVARAVQSGNQHRIKAERRELRGAKRELREDTRAFVRKHRR
jgi:DNA-binding LytR/AlgR family response regulator